MPLRPFWSPDSRFLGFFAGGKLKKIEALGGQPITLGDAPDNRGGAWNHDGAIVFNPGNRTALQKVDASGGLATAATVLGEEEQAHMRPSFLPDGRHFLIVRSRVREFSQIYLASLDSTERKYLLNADSRDVFYSQGHLLFLREPTLLAQPFDAAAPCSDWRCFSDCRTDSDSRNQSAYVGSSQRRRMGYWLIKREARRQEGSQLVWVDRSGKQIGVLRRGRLHTVTLSFPRTVSGLPSTFPDGQAAGHLAIGCGAWTEDAFYIRPSGRSIADLVAGWQPVDLRLAPKEGHLDLYQKSSSGRR